MKKIFLAIAFLSFLSPAFSQLISKITIGSTAGANIIAFGLDENVQVYVSIDGNITRWGFDRFIGYTENYAGTLEPYVGRTEYYTPNDDEALRGKVKYIGKTLLTYYASYENEALKGKIKSIGSTNLDYYLSYDNEAYRGNIKTIGRDAITWFSSFENEAFRGKLKSVGPTAITYYRSFEDKAYRGKVKSIDRSIFTYYSSFELYSGSIKTGNPVLIANGIKYFAYN
ncbi:MAG TPA: hypothetical protein VK489_13200 [Ferruginibacter sp.]|nr:hypothetical protein [Ferruginibacter sp.]